MSPLEELEYKLGRMILIGVAVLVVFGIFCVYMINRAEKEQARSRHERGCTIEGETDRGAHFYVCKEYEVR